MSADETKDLFRAEFGREVDMPSHKEDRMLIVEKQYKDPQILKNLSIFCNNNALSLLKLHQPSKQSYAFIRRLPTFFFILVKQS